MVCWAYPLTKLSKLNNTFSSDKAISNPKGTLPVSPQHRLSWPGDKAGAPHAIGPGFEFLCKVVFIVAHQAQFVGRRSAVRARQQVQPLAGPKLKVLKYLRRTFQGDSNPFPLHWRPNKWDVWNNTQLPKLRLQLRCSQLQYKFVLSQSTSPTICEEKVLPL